MRISYLSSDVCSSDLDDAHHGPPVQRADVEGGAGDADLAVGRLDDEGARGILGDPEIRLPAIEPHPPRFGVEVHRDGRVGFEHTLAAVAESTEVRRVGEGWVRQGGSWGLQRQ